MKKKNNIFVKADKSLIFFLYIYTRTENESINELSSLIAVLTLFDIIMSTSVVY